MGDTKGQRMVDICCPRDWQPPRDRHGTKCRVEDRTQPKQFSQRSRSEASTQFQKTATLHRERTLAKHRLLELAPDGHFTPRSVGGKTLEDIMRTPRIQPRR